MADLAVTTDGAIATVTINRPRQRNSVTLAMWWGFVDVFSALDANPEVRVIILAGAGDDFSTGADIAEFAAVRDDLAQSKAYEVAVDAGCAAIAHVDKPVIAVCRGYTLGGGAHIAMSADFRFAASDALFGIPAARLSIVYGAQATRKLLALVGLTEAKRILYSAERFGAAHALRTGFVDDVSDEPLAAAQAFAATLADQAPLTQAGAKLILNGATFGALDAARIDAAIDAASASADYAEGRRAFAEKRAPRFVGA
ncbi:enoyl-CoA hydratase-related protein [Acuticoccus mangrovi]|uniref:Enoyl-CoA hydratase/isomerase family protein n=1 Tax=Acuticoccus mangrovi TaxID=2796142 RepID=A0A934MHL4_9HYPH|nr:enoyl-CoA hydratase-related protein [Acuticoccus mangrovi]MBJ3777055.1 enoyl-CoA hydratase/isomerase family protein [Acuticoccus mangrovi]